MNEREIHISKAGNSLGPYPESRVRELLVQGELLPTDHAWCLGEDGWKPLSELLEKPAPSEGGKEASSGKRAISKKMKIGIACVCALILLSAATVIAIKYGYSNTIIAKIGLATIEEDPLVIELREELGVVDSTLEKELDKIRATNEPVTIEELAKWGKVPEDNKNAALAFNKIVRPEQAGKDLGQIMRAQFNLRKKLGISSYSQMDEPQYEQQLLGTYTGFVQKHQQYLIQLYKLHKNYNLDEHPAWFAQEPMTYANYEEKMAIYAKFSGCFRDLEVWVTVSGLQGNTEAAVEGILTMIFLSRLLEQSTDGYGQYYRMAFGIGRCISATKKLLMTRTLNPQQLEKLQVAFNKFNISDILYRDLICMRCILITQAELARNGKAEQAGKIILPGEGYRFQSLIVPEQMNESEHNMDMTLLLGASSKLISLVKEGYPSRYQAQSGLLANKLDRFMGYMEPTQEQKEKMEKKEEELKEEYPEIDWDASSEEWEKVRARREIKMKSFYEINPKWVRYLFSMTGINNMRVDQLPAKMELRLQTMKAALAIERYRWNNNGKLPKGLDVLTKNDGVLNPPFDPLELNNKKLKYVILGANEGYQVITLYRDRSFTENTAKSHGLELNFKKRLR